MGPDSELLWGGPCLKPTLFSQSPEVPDLSGLLLSGTADRGSIASGAVALGAHMSKVFQH